MNPLQKKLHRLAEGIITEIRPHLRACGLEEISSSSRKPTGFTILDDDPLVILSLWIKNANEGILTIEDEQDCIKISLYLSQGAIDTLDQKLSAIVKILNEHTKTDIMLSPRVSTAATQWIFAREVRLQN